MAIIQLILCLIIANLCYAFFQIQITHTDPKWHPLWWLGFVVILTSLCVAGVRFSFMVELAFTILSLLVLVVFYCGAIPEVDFPRVKNEPSQQHLFKLIN